MPEANKSDEQVIKETWSRYWGRKKGAVDQWDALSEIILHAVLQECGDARGLKILEAGCGTGRISGRLAQTGANVICLDISPEALELTKQGVGVGGNVELALGSILDLPDLPACDIVWNAGVLEHFVQHDQRRAIDEFLSILKRTGKIIILTPYSGSLVYRLGKFLLEATGHWHYGRETPVYSLAGALPARGRLEREYTIAFLPLIFDAHKFVPLLRCPLSAAWNLMQGLIGISRCARLDNALSRLLGGYLLVSVISSRVAEE